jgi:hypothetical protein
MRVIGPHCYTRCSRISTDCKCQYVSSGPDTINQRRLLTLTEHQLKAPHALQPCAPISTHYRRIATNTSSTQTRLFGANTSPVTTEAVLKRRRSRAPSLAQADMHAHSGHIARSARRSAPPLQAHQHFWCLQSSNTHAWNKLGGGPDTTRLRMTKGRPVDQWSAIASQAAAPLHMSAPNAFQHAAVLPVTGVAAAWGLQAQERPRATVLLSRSTLSDGHSLAAGRPLLGACKSQPRLRRLHHHVLMVQLRAMRFPPALTCDPCWFIR